MSVSITTLAKAFLVTFAIFAFLAFSPLQFIPMLFSLAAADWAGIALLLLILGAPFGGFLMLFLFAAVRRDYEFFWRDAAGLAGFWFGAVSGSVFGLHTSGVLE